MLRISSMPEAREHGIHPRKFILWWGAIVSLRSLKYLERVDQKQIRYAAGGFAQLRES